jgi:hypothetical protein
MVQIRRRKMDNTVSFLATDYSRSGRGRPFPEGEPRYDEQVRMISVALKIDCTLFCVAQYL